MPPARVIAGPRAPHFHSPCYEGALSDRGWRANPRTQITPGAETSFRVPAAPRRASASSRVRALTCSCRSARVELAWRAAGFGALLRSGLVVLACCVFAGLRLIVRRRLTEPFTGADDHTLPHHGVRCAPQQVHPRLAAMGQTRPWRHVGVESVLPPTSDIGRRRRHGSSVPIAT
jgi:hypothetical protein